MAKTPKNQGKPWTSANDAQLRELARGNTPTGLIAHMLGRSEASI